MIVKLLMIAEMEVPDARGQEDAVEQAQEVLDRFRDSVGVSENYGITLSRTNQREIIRDVDDEDFLYNGWTAEERP